MYLSVTFFISEVPAYLQAFSVMTFALHNFLLIKYSVRSLVFLLIGHSKVMRPMKGYNQNTNDLIERFVNKKLCSTRVITEYH